METLLDSRNWVGLAVGVLATLLLMLTLPRANYQPIGLALPAKQTMPASNPDRVTLYASIQAPSKILGTVNVMRHYSGESDEAQKQIIQTARELAASLGANGLVVRLFGHTGDNVASAQAVYQLSGDAIHTS